MKKRLYLTIALVLLTACAQFMPAEEAAVEGELTGTEGLYMAFMPNTPPPVIRDNTRGLPIMLLLENRGTYSNITGSIYLSGFDSNIIEDVAQTQAIPDLPGRTPFVPRGQTAIMQFSANIANLAAFHTDRYKSILMATACYVYETTAGGELCVDFNPFSVTQIQKVCTPQSIQLTGGQGAPIGVGLIEVEPGQGITRLIIHIQNMGGGEVFLPDAIGTCNPYHPQGLQYSQVDYVDVEEIIVSNIPITADCQPNDKVRLSNGEGIIYCTLDKQQRGPFSLPTAFISPLNIKLKYGYRQSIAQPLEVRPSR